MSSYHHIGVRGEVDHTKSLSDHIGALYLNDEYSDLVLKVGGETLRTHKLILASRSAYFRAMLFGGMMESLQDEVELKDTNVTPFKVLLKYIYTGQITLGNFKSSEILEILGLAHQYRFEELEDAICCYLRQRLTVENVLEIFDLSRQFQLQALTTVCGTFIDENAAKFLASDKFLNLTPGSLKEILKRDSFCVPETNIFLEVVKWAQYNSLEGTDELKDVVSAIRFSLIDAEDLFRVVRPFNYVDSNTLLDAVQVKYTGTETPRYRGVLKRAVDWATTGHGAVVLEGEMKNALLNPSQQNLDRVYTNHVISETGNKAIVIKLGNQALVNHIKMLLYDLDLRAFSYYIEVSVDKNTWHKVVDYTKYHCRSWQELYFEPRVVLYIRIVGTHNTINKIFHLVSFSIMYVTNVPEMIGDIIKPVSNVALPRLSAVVIEGVSRSRNGLLDENSKAYDWDSGYTCHQIGSGSIVVQLGQPFMLDSMRLLLWDCDARTYSYYIEVSLNMVDWEVVWDKRNEECRSWQLASFNPTPVVFIKIVGTHNSANEVFHLVHLECPAQCESLVEQGKMKKSPSEESDTNQEGTDET